MKAKILCARCLCWGPIGWTIGKLFRDRIPHFGCRIDTSHGAVSASLKSAMFWRIYESAETRFIRRYLRADLDCIELGGSLGVTGAHILQRLDAESRLISVEANASVIPTLEANLSRHAGGREWIVHRAAITAATGATRLWVGGSLESRVVTVGNESCQTVPGIRLTDLLDRYQIADFTIVSDIEGGEAAFILGDRPGLARCRQLIIELHDPPPGEDGPGVANLSDALTRVHGFSVVARHGPVLVCER